MATITAMKKLGENKQTMTLSGLAEGNNIKAMATPQPADGCTRGTARNARFVRGRSGLPETGQPSGSYFPKRRSRTTSPQKTVSPIQSLGGDCIMCIRPS